MENKYNRNIFIFFQSDMCTDFINVQVFRHTSGGGWYILGPQQKTLKEIKDIFLHPKKYPSKVLMVTSQEKWNLSTKEKLEQLKVSICSNQGGEFFFVSQATIVGETGETLGMLLGIEEKSLS